MSDLPQRLVAARYLCDKCHVPRYQELLAELELLEQLGGVGGGGGSLPEGWEMEPGWVTSPTGQRLPYKLLPLFAYMNTMAQYFNSVTALDVERVHCLTMQQPEQLEAWALRVTAAQQSINSAAHREPGVELISESAATAIFRRGVKKNPVYQKLYQQLEVEINSMREDQMTIPNVLSKLRRAHVGQQLADRFDRQLDFSSGQQGKQPAEARGTGEFLQIPVKGGERAVKRFIAQVPTPLQKQLLQQLQAEWDRAEPLVAAAAAGTKHVRFDDEDGQQPADQGHGWGAQERFIPSAAAAAAGSRGPAGAPAAGRAPAAAGGGGAASAGGVRPCHCEARIHRDWEVCWVTNPSKMPAGRTGPPRGTRDRVLFEYHCYLDGVRLPEGQGYLGPRPAGGAGGASGSNWRSSGGGGGAGSSSSSGGGGAGGRGRTPFPVAGGAYFDLSTGPAAAAPVVAMAAAAGAPRSRSSSRGREASGAGAAAPAAAAVVPQLTVHAPALAGRDGDVLRSLAAKEAAEQRPLLEVSAAAGNVGAAHSFTSHLAEVAARHEVESQLSGQLVISVPLQIPRDQPELDTLKQRSGLVAAVRQARASEGDAGAAGPSGSTGLLVAAASSSSSSSGAPAASHELAALGSSSGGAGGVSEGLVEPPSSSSGAGVQSEQACTAVAGAAGLGEQEEEANDLAFLAQGPGGPELVLPGGRRTAVALGMLDPGSQLAIISAGFARNIGLQPQPIPWGPRQLRLANGVVASIAQYYPGLTLVLLRGTDHEVAVTLDWYAAAGLEELAEIIIPIQAFHAWMSGGIDHLTSRLKIRPFFKSRGDPTQVTVPVRWLRGTAARAAAAVVAAALQTLQVEGAGTVGAASQLQQEQVEGAGTAGAASQLQQEQVEGAGTAGAASQLQQEQVEGDGTAGAASRLQQGQEAGAGTAGAASQQRRPAGGWRLACLVTAMVAAVWQALGAMRAAARAAFQWKTRPLGAAAAAAGPVTTVTGTGDAGDGAAPPDWGALYDSAVAHESGEATAAAGGVWAAPRPRCKLRHPGSTVSLRRLTVLLLLLLVGLVVGSPLVAAGRAPRGTMGQEGAAGASFRWPSA
jgi:hypothetical protein